MTNRLHSTTCAFIWLVASSLLLAMAPRALAQMDNNTEYRVKLGFLYNFAEFVKWPSSAFRSPAAPLVMCVAGQDPFDREIEQELRSRTVGGHPVEIKRLKPHDDPRACHIIFVRADEKRAAARLLASVKGSSTLTVGETQSFVNLGGDITLTLENKRLRFEVNLDAAEQTRLKISSKLLALAKIVDPARNH
jgi:YfiR/HmsC-like